MVRMHGFDTRWVQNYTMYAMFFHGAVELSRGHCEILHQTYLEGSGRNLSELVLPGLNLSSFLKVKLFPHTTSLDSC